MRNARFLVTFLNIDENGSPFYNTEYYTIQEDSNGPIIPSFKSLENIRIDNCRITERSKWCSIVGLVKIEEFDDVEDIFIGKEIDVNVWIATYAVVITIFMIVYFISTLGV